jgi:hypothetical protein
MPRHPRAATAEASSVSRGSPGGGSPPPPPVLRASLRCWAVRTALPRPGHPAAGPERNAERGGGACERGSRAAAPPRAEPVCPPGSGGHGDRSEPEVSGGYKRWRTRTGTAVSAAPASVVLWAPASPAPERELAQLEVRTKSARSWHTSVANSSNITDRIQSGWWVGVPQRKYARSEEAECAGAGAA